MFDLDVAIKVCRSASVEHALALAKRHEKHEHCLSILTEDKQNFCEAVEYIRNLTFSDAESNLKKYGIILMQQCPNETTELVNEMCTNFRSHTNDVELFDKTNEIDRSNPEEFVHLFANVPDRLIDFLEHLTRNLSSCEQFVYNTLIELYLGCWKENKMAENRLLEILVSNSEMYDKSQALILCRMYSFWPGILHIYEEQKL